MASAKWFSLIKLTLICVAISIVIASNGEPSASWPAIDNFPSVCGILRKCEISQEDLLSFVNSKASLRLPYQLALAGIGKILGGSPYAALTVAKAVIMVLYPTGIFLLTENLLTRFNGANRNGLTSISNAGGRGDKYSSYWELFIAFIITLLACDKEGFVWKFAIAWWSPSVYTPGPGWVAQALVFFGITTCAGHQYSEKGGNVIVTVLLTIATCVQPICTVFALIFLSIFMERREVFNKFTLIGIVAGVSLIAVIVKYDAGGTVITSAEMNRIYVDIFHSNHYLVSRYAIYSQYFKSWIEPAVLIVGMQVGLTSMCYVVNKDRRILKIGILSGILFIFSIMLQLASNHGFGGTLIIAMGPSRFLMYGPLSVLMLLGVALNSVIGKLLATIYRGHRKAPISSCHNIELLRMAKYVSLIAPIFTAWMIADFCQKDTRADRNLTKNQKEIVSWIARNTGPNELFAASQVSGMPTIISTFAKRPVYFGHGFPFDTDMFYEHEERFAINTSIFNILGDEYSDAMGFDFALKRLSAQAKEYILKPRMGINRAASKNGLKYLIGTSAFGKILIDKGCKPVHENGDYRIFATAEVVSCWNLRDGD